MYYARFGSMLFADWPNAPEVAQTQWEMVEKEGVEGVQYEDMGYSPAIYTTPVMCDVLNEAAAHDLLRAWQAMSSGPALPLVLGSYSYPNYFKLLRVTNPHFQKVVVVYNGVTQSLYGVPGTAICTAQFVLREWMPGSF